MNKKVKKGKDVRPAHTPILSLCCAECGDVVTNTEKLASPGAVKLGFVLCSFKCAQSWTAATGMV